ncbi:MAG: zinc ribbon domain-containing protein [candidate division WOR-3 bacterium]
MSEDFAKIKTEIEDVKEKLRKIEEKRGSVSESVYRKVKEDYERRLKDLTGKIAGQKELIKESLKEITTKKESLRTKLNELQEQLEEIELRHSIGEYTEDQYNSLSQEIKTKIQSLEEELEYAKKEEKEAKTLLGEEEPIIEESLIEEAWEEPEVEEKEEKEEEPIEIEPLPEVSEDEKIAEELFTGAEITAEENENVTPNVSATLEEEETLSASSEEDWLVTLEKELSGETEEERTPEKVTQEKTNAEPNLFSVCPKCNHKNRPDAWYCENCGGELATTE